MSFPLIITILPPHYLWFALPLARDGTVCSSLAEHLMVDSAIIISHRSVNNHYCLLTSLFMRSTVTKMVFFPCFPCGSLFYRPALNLAQLYSVPENYSSFTDTQHKERFSFLLKIKMFSRTDLDLPSFRENKASKLISEHLLFSVPIS